MLYPISQANHLELTYRGGQNPIVHLEFDLQSAVEWSNVNGRRWAFTLSNAGSYYFEDRCDITQLNEIDWTAVHARQWRFCEERKQAEFLVEKNFPLALVERIGVHNRTTYEQVELALAKNPHKPLIKVIPDWYY